MNPGRVVAALCLGVATAAWGGPADLTADQMRALGQSAITHGFADQALNISQALLQRDASDSAALLMQAQALRLKGDLTGSEAAARRAWATATDRPSHYLAATALAQALSLQDHWTRAQYWLRQAVENAPNAAAQSQAVQDFAYVRGQNPVSLQFSGSVRRSDNVNGGGRVQYIQIGPFILPLPSTLLALPGLSWTLGLSGQYRLSDDGQSLTALTFGANAQGVVLSDAARALAPDLVNGDFLYQQVQVGLQRRSALSFGRVTADLSLTHSWYADLDLANSLTGQLTFERPVSADLNLYLSTDLTRELRLDTFDSSSTTLRIAGGLTQTLVTGDQVDVSLDLSRVASVDIGIDRREAGLLVYWQARQPVVGLGLAANLSARYTLYANAREDTHYGVGMSATINRATFLGFAPVVSLDVAHNDSTVPWFSSDTVALGLSVKSRF